MANANFYKEGQVQTCARYTDPRWHREGISKIFVGGIERGMTQCEKNYFCLNLTKLSFKLYKLS